MTHSKDYWNGYVDETNYAGGDGGATYAETEPANTAALTSQNYPFNESQDFPSIEYKQEAVKAPGQNADVVKTFTSGLDILVGKKVQYVQNATWIGKAVGYKDNEGELPTGSWCEVFKDGQRIRAAYGCYLTNYQLTWDGPSFPKETVDYRAYNVKSTTEANFATAKSWDSTAVKIHKDITLTVDGTTYETKNGTLTIVPKFIEPDNRQSGAFYHKFPYFTEFEKIEVEFGLYAYDSDHFVDLETETADLFSITLAVWGQTLTLSNMKLKNETINIRTMPEKGMKPYTGTFEMGGDVNPTLA